MKKNKLFSCFKTLLLLVATFISTNLLAQIPSTFCDGNPADWANFRTTYPINGYTLDVANDGTNNDNSFTQGTKDGDLISAWRWVNGNTNNKGDITNAGVALTGTNNCILRFFGDRTAVNGDASIAFWLLINPVAALSNGTFSGSHTNGDLLITSEFTNGGSVPVITVYIWQNGALVQKTAVSTNYCAGVNAATAAVPAGLTYTASNGSTSYAPGAFFEGAVNLCAFNINSCFSQFVIRTRNSQSINASVQDFALNSFNAMPQIPAVVVTQPGCTVAKGAISVTNANSGYTYTLTGINPVVPAVSNNTGTFTNLAAGTYSLSVFQNMCNSAPLTITINPQPPTPAAPTLSVTQPTCTSAVNSISVTAPVGAGYTYSLDGGAFSTTSSWSNLSAATHCVKVSNSYGCRSAQACATINVQPPTPAAPSLTVVQPTCTTASNSITVNSPSGSYSLDGAAFGPTTSWSNLSPGNHCIRATNSSGCISAQTCVVINAQPPTPSAPTLNVVQATCTSVANSITVTGPHGSGLVYSIDGGTFSTTSSWTNLPVGQHCVRVRNSYGCVGTQTCVTINAQPPTPAAPTLGVVQPTCTSASNSITVTSPLDAGLLYSLDGGTFSSAASWSDLSVGQHCVRVSNSYGCVGTQTCVTINAQPPTPAAPTLSVVQPTCTSASNSLTVTAPLDPAMSYSIDGGAFSTTTSWSNLSAGQHCVRVTNSFGCVGAETCVTIDAQPPTPAAPTFNVLQPSCVSAANGITVTAPTDAGLTYSLDGAAFGSTKSWVNLSAGSHCVRVSNTYGCISPEACVTINSPYPSTGQQCFAVSNPGCLSCNLRYPDTSNLPRSAVVFSESEVLRYAEPGPSTCGNANTEIKMYYNDEHAMILGVRKVIVKTATGTTTTDYAVTPTPSSPSCVSAPLVGTTTMTGDQSGNDVAAGGGRPLWPALFVTDLTLNGMGSRAGDWQQGGTGIAPHKICGTWKAAVRTVDYTKTPAAVTVMADADPAKNNWTLGTGSNVPDVGFSALKNEGYGAEVVWNVNQLGLIAGHTYRLQFMVHDGDQNKVGGDAGESCTTIVMGGAPTPATDGTVKTTWTVNADSTVTIKATIAKTLVDNTYGTNAIGYPSTHKFADMVNTDNMELALYDAAGQKKMDFTMDYLSASNTVPSGYKSLGVSGGDGSISLGNAADVISVRTSLDSNFNARHYVLTSNSPATNSSYTPNSTYPNWDFNVTYTARVKLSVFGTACFGYPQVVKVNATPNKLGTTGDITFTTANCPANREAQAAPFVKQQNDPDPVRVALYPNPAFDYATLTVEAIKDGPVVVTIANSGGSTMYSKKQTLTTGFNQIFLSNLKNFAPGIYNVKVIVGNKTATRQFIITR